jgi:hypothetical protein
VSGDLASVQGAVQAAQPGATVQILAGTYSWSGSLLINKPITLRGETPDTTIVNDRTEGQLVQVTPSPEGIIKIDSLTFVQGPAQVQDGTRHLAVYFTSGGKPVLVHDCTFSSRRPLRHIEWATNGGVISHCLFISEDQSDISCIAFKALALPDTWEEPSSLGMAGDPDGTKNTYLEDCTFKDAYLQALDLDDNSRTVVRHCTFDNSAITSHGQDTSPSGVRQFEVYNNEFIFTVGGNCTPNPFPLNMNYWFYVRGGIGVITDNVIPQISSCAWGMKGSINLTVYNIRRNGGQIPCQTSYPAAHQLGQGPEGTTDPLYIWNNSGSGANTIGLVNYDPDECGNNQQVTDYLQIDRDYFLIPRPPANYQKFTYPHPLAH